MNIYIVRVIEHDHINHIKWTEIADAIFWMTSFFDLQKIVFLSEMSIEIMTYFYNFQRLACPSKIS